MANTANLQAVIAYKRRSTDGAPLDINGKPTSETGRKQAIALLVGRTNPNPALFEVEFYFSAGGTVAGTPTVEFNPDTCPIGFIRVTPNTLILNTDTPMASVLLESSGQWHIQSAPAIAQADRGSGLAGEYLLNIRAINEKLSALFTTGALRKTGTVNGGATEYKRTSASNSSMFKVRTGVDHFYSGTIDNATYAGVGYYTEAFAFLGYECGDLQTYDKFPLTIPPTAFYMAACSLGGNPVIELEQQDGQGYFVFINEDTGQTASLYVAFVFSRPWVLADGTWNMLGFWYNDAIWTTP